MSKFYSLDDDDEAGPSDQGSQIGAGVGALSPSARNHTTPRGKAASSSSNPIYALLNGQAGGSSTTGVDKERQRYGDEPPIIQLQKAWVSERGCPEILPWRGNAIDDVCSQIEEQMVSAVCYRMQPSSPADEKPS